MNISHNHYLKEWESGNNKLGVRHFLTYYYCYYIGYKSLGEISKNKSLEKIIIETQKRRGFSEEQIEKAARARGNLSNFLNNAFNIGVKEVIIPNNIVAQGFPK